MSTRAKRFSAMGMILVLSLILHFSCAGGGGGVVAQFTIGGKTYTFKLGTTGVFSFRVGDPPQRNPGLVTPRFEQTPSDTPSSAVIALKPTDVDVIPLGPGKFQPAAQAVTGSAQLTVYIASASSTDPCNEGVLLGTFGLTFSEGVVSIDQASLDVPAAAMPFVLPGTFTICLELTATVDIQLTIAQMGVTYGAEEPPIENVNENVGEADNENVAEPDNENVTDVDTTGLEDFTLTVNVQGEGSVGLSPPGGVYEEGTEVTLTATAAADWLFVRWEGDLESVTNPGTILMDGDKTVTAVLRQPERVFDDPTDFEEGTLEGLEFDPAAGGLQISSESTTLPFIWVPNSNQGTISKVDTRTGNELGRYRVSPEDLNGNPSRTTVELQGNCYVANRNTGTMVKVGLVEKGGCTDRNGNGSIETSADLNSDGDITDDELLAWGADECVLYEVLLDTPGEEGTYAPGTFTGTYANDYWNPGTRGIAVDASNNVWVGVYGTHMYYHINGSTGEIINSIDVSSVNHNPYGAVIDPNGILWSSSYPEWHVLKLNTADYSFTALDLPHQSYGLAVDRNNHLFVTGRDQYQMSRINTLSDEIDWTVPAKYSRGIALTDDDDLWTADSLDGTVTRWTNDGTEKQAIPVGSDPTGVAVDADGYVWVVNNGDAYTKRITPASNEVDLEKAIVGTLHYGYSDMTGIVARSVSTQIGNWTVDYGSADQEAIWDTVAWGSEEPEGTSVAVRVRTSNDLVTWSDWVAVTNGSDLATVLTARYLQVEATLQILSGDLSPILSYLAVFTED